MSVYDSYYLTPDDYAKAEKNGISKALLEDRFYRKNWNKKRAINQARRETNKHRKYIKQAKNNGISLNTYRVRLVRGWSMQDASTVPLTNKKERINRVRKANRKYPEWVYDNLEKNNIKITTFYTRVNDMHWSLEDASTLPILKAGQRHNKEHPWQQDEETRYAKSRGVDHEQTQIY